MVNDSVPKLICFPNFGLVKVSMLPWSWTVPRLLVSKIFPERFTYRIRTVRFLIDSFHFIYKIELWNVYYTI